MCAQTLEKSLKAYLIVNRVTPAMDHRPDKYLEGLLSTYGQLLRFPEHRPVLSALFDAETKATLRALLKLTPGADGAATDQPNTEYPWKDEGQWARVPAGAPEFSNPGDQEHWIRVAGQVRAQLFKLAISTVRGP